MLSMKNNALCMYTFGSEPYSIDGISDSETECNDDTSIFIARQ